MNGPVAYLGPPGTFAGMAVRQLPDLTGRDQSPVPSVTTALDQLRAGAVDAAVVPIENSVEGSVSGTLDELSATPALRITAETAVPVRFTLLAAAPLQLERIARVGTHPHASAQCRRWIHDNLPHATVVTTGSTAGAAEEIARGDAAFDAAIASPLAAEHFGLVALATDIADNPDAVTRFVQVERPGRLPAPTGADKTSLLLYMRANRAGALLEILTELAVRGINMTRLESRPTRQVLGEYCFSVDIEGHVREERIADALLGLHRICAEVVFLGSYPRWDGRAAVVPQGLSDEALARARQWLRGLQEG